MTHTRHEKKIEDRLVTRVRLFGGRAIKLGASGYRGIPDRLILFHGFMGLVEVKTERPGSRLAETQKAWRDWCQQNEIPHEIVDSIETVDDYICRRTKGRMI